MRGRSWRRGRAPLFTRESLIKSGEHPAPAETVMIVRSLRGSSGGSGDSPLHARLNQSLASARPHQSFAAGIAGLRIPVSISFAAGYAWDRRCTKPKLNLFL